MFNTDVLSLLDVLILGSFLILSALWFFRRNGRKLPPGPYCLPVVGYLPFLTFKPYIKLMKLANTYGPVFSLRLGHHYTVVLCDYQSMKEAFAQDAFMGRPPNSPFELSDETIRTEAINGLPWKEQRRVSMHILRDLGLGKSIMEQHIKEEISELIGRMEKKCGSVVNVSKILAPSMSNNIASLVFGKRRTYDDPKRILLDKVLREVGLYVGKTAWLMFFPWMKPVARMLGISKQKELSEALQHMKNYAREEIEEHKKTLDRNNIRDFIDGYLLEIEKQERDPNSTFKEDVMQDLVGGFFGAGSETVRVTTDWLLLISATYQDVQRKVQAEIDNVIGNERLPSRDDQKKMPYTVAVITETIRWRTTIPLNLFRWTLQDTKLGGYDIPKHSYIWGNLWAVHHDPNIWGNDVEDFKPERFLSEDMKEFQKSEYFIPFSIGKRSCPGESLANIEVFMYFTSLLQKFRFELPSGSAPDFDGQLGIGLQPKPYELVYRMR